MTNRTEPRSGTVRGVLARAGVVRVEGRVVQALGNTELVRVALMGKGFALRVGAAAELLQRLQGDKAKFHFLRSLIADLEASEQAGV